MILNGNTFQYAFFNVLYLINLPVNSTDFSSHTAVVLFFRDPQWHLLIYQILIRKKIID